MTFLLFGSFFALLFLGVPVAFSLAASSIIYLLAAGIPLAIVPRTMFAGMDSFVLLSVIGFILAGNLMTTGGVIDRVVRLSNAAIGHVRGGLGLANIVASVIFAGKSGSALADVASLGTALIPAMKKEGYDAPFAVAVTAASSTIGPILPPSISMILLGSIGGISITGMFMGGILPGLTMAFAMMIVSYIISKKKNHPKGPRGSLKEFWVALKDASWGIMLTILLLSGLFGGMFTPSEAASLAVIYAIIIGLFIYKDLKLHHLPKIFADSCTMIAGIMLLIGFARVFGWILSAERIPQAIAQAMFSLTTNPILIVLFINLILLLAGMFMETNASIMILTPMLLGVATEVGMAPIQFGVMMLFNLVIGLITPPVGVCLFVAADCGKISLKAASYAILPFIAVNFAVLLLIAYIPAFTLWLPSFLR